MIEERDLSESELQQILMKNENHLLDFKSRLINPAKLQQTFVAFANADGGDLYVGIEDTKSQNRVIGFSNPEEANDIIKHLLMETTPAIEGVEAEFLKISDQLILHFIIPKSEKVHYTASGECMQRVNASSLKIKGDQVTQLAYAKGFYKFEEQKVEASEIEDILEAPHLSEYMQRIGSYQEPIRFLRRNRLTTGKDDAVKPSVACVLLFDEEPQEVLHSKASVKILRMKTISADYKREQLDLNMVLSGPLEKLAKTTEEKIYAIINDESISITGTKLEASYPIEAVHEILVNAFLHRDYSIADDIHVSIFDNRIEIKSPGRLPGNVTKDNILKAHFSRNPNLVRIINKLPNPMNHDLGEGLTTAFNAMRKAGLVSPEINEVDNNVIVTLHHRKITSYEEQIIEYLKTHDWITNKIARSITGDDSENKIKKSLQKLRKAERIIPEDPNASRFKFRYRLNK
ncbi:RNA-binding domain-containing protein [Paenibacillus sp. FSL L8-0470]|uniref:RNA-binding domain-containing protein n=1 Tax=Paenibacillus sp. FSL L8-0470 TaxID=2954688 RepID=UPI0030F6D3B0